MTVPLKVYYFPLNDEQEEAAPIAIPLKEAGGKLVADLSALPAEMQSTLTKQGVPDRFHQGSVFPTDGPLFLEALVREADAYRRFRTAA